MAANQELTDRTPAFFLWPLAVWNIGTSDPAYGPTHIISTKTLCPRSQMTQRSPSTQAHGDIGPPGTSQAVCHRDSATVS
jgi:hypothetical protein